MAAISLAGIIPGDPAVIPLLTILGGFLGAARARLQREGREEIRRATENGAFIGTGIGVLVYLSVLIGRLI